MHFEQLGPYRIGRQLGRGGMGTVFEGVNSETGQAAAVKVLNPHLAQEEGFRERFGTEIETLKKLKHSNIVRLYGFGEQDGFLYYAMERIGGTNLEDELQAGRRFDWRETTHLGIKLARALKHAHDHGVIHRDLKPANLLLTEDGDIKLTDFGIARLFGNSRLTMDGGLIGTAEYMAPEQADGRQVTYHCDLYSLGGVLFAMLAGRPPFRGGSLPEVLQLQRFAAPPPVSRLAADVPAELEGIINRLLSKNPQERGANAMVVAKQLAAMEYGLSVVPRENESSQADLEQLEDREPPRPGKTPGAEEDYDPTASTQRGEQAPLHPPFVPPSISPRAPVAGTIQAKGQEIPSISKPTESRPVPASNGAPADKAGPAPVSLLASPVKEGAPPSHTQAANRFTTIKEEELGRAEETSTSGHGPPWVQIVALSACLMAVIGFGYYLMRPPSADQLSAQIQSVATDEPPERLLDAEDDIQSFLARFPQDPRGQQFRRYLDEIDLLRLERRVERQPRLLGQEDTLLPIQRDYIEAKSYSSTMPDRSSAMLQAILDLYGSEEKPSDTTVKFLELTRRQLKRLHERESQQAPAYLTLIDANLKRAQQLRAADLAGARAIWNGIIELYGEKPWAADRVAQARAALSESMKTTSTTKNER